MKKIIIIIGMTVFLFALTSCKPAVLEGTESSVNETGDISKVKVTAPSANIRSGCSANAGVLQSANANDTFDVVSQVGEWYAVQLPDNSIGFIPVKQSKPIVDETSPIKMPSTAQRTPIDTNTAKNPSLLGAKKTGNAPSTNTGTSGNTAKNSANNNTNKTASSNSLSSAEQEMVDLVNQARAQNNLPALKVDLALANVARTKAKDMKDNNYFSHNSPTYGSPFDMMKSFSIRYIKAGENIAGNQSVQAAHDALMKSPGHRANILNPDYTDIGIGIVEGGPYGNMFSQMFISK